MIPADFLAWIGINFLRWYHRLPSTELYWSTFEDLAVDVVKKAMSRDRYQQITRMLHLAENDKIPDRKSPDYDRMYKIRRSADMLSEKFLENMSCSSHFSIDESMVKFKGRVLQTVPANEADQTRFQSLEPLRFGNRIPVQVRHLLWETSVRNELN